MCLFCGKVLIFWGFKLLFTEKFYMLSSFNENFALGKSAEV